MAAHGPDWEPAEDRILRKYYASMGAGWCSMVTGRCRSGVYQRARKLAIKGRVYRDHARLSADQVRAIRDNPKSKTQQEMADEYGVHLNTVWQVASYATYYHIR